ncbi:RNA polymerase sigma factor [Chitinophaga alhagiae]|uniref:RNA polymerase sigma factor n=1 Tax=Chitinophaga alhagiae TaxID=2203219 RepID=UPI001300AEC8|nr:RNA polymerase sigma factor [Chitinophaga alhagiae]
MIATPDQVSDQELVARVLAGEKGMFETIIRRYNQRLYRIGMSVLNSDTDAEDAMQNAYIKAYEHLAGFEHRAAFSTWLTRIMLNQCYEQKRKNRHMVAPLSPTDNFMHMDTPANDLVNKELGNVLEHAVAQLPEKYRLVFVLREIEDLSVKDTSETLDIEESNVKVRLNRAKVMLRKSLAGYVKDHVYSFHLSRCNRIVSHVMGKLGA